jgi:hypothetical protein
MEVPEGAEALIQQLAAREASKKSANTNMLAAVEDLADAGIIIGVGTPKRTQRAACVAVRPASDPEMALIFRASPNVEDSNLTVCAELTRYTEIRKAMEKGLIPLESSCLPAMRILRKSSVPNTPKALLGLIKSALPQSKPTQAV